MYTIWKRFAAGKDHSIITLLQELNSKREDLTDPWSLTKLQAHCFLNSLDDVMAKCMEAITCCDELDPSHVAHDYFQKLTLGS